MCLVRVFIFVRKAEQWIRAQGGEERWDESTKRRGEMRWEYREERRQNYKKNWSMGPRQSKKLIIYFAFIMELPLNALVYCLKSPPATFQNILFKHEFFSNNFQTTLFWTLWPNIFFQILDTSVQCLNTEHCVLSWQTIRLLSLLLVLIIFLV